MKPVSLGVKPFVLLFLMLYVPMLLIGWAVDGMQGRLANPVGGESSAVWMLLVLVTLLSTPLFLAMLRRSITLDGGTLTIKSSFYTRRLDVKDIESIEANGPAPELLHRINGFCTAGFHSGWYTTVQDHGRQFVDCSREPNIHIRLKGTDSGIYLEVEDPEAFKRRLEAVACTKERRQVS